ncbi:MAG: cbb3-type cytochrome c oxidase subunit 3 [Betaproteobacteria bacterium]|nr:cbb3-type cytochrome c oxidase subunit 3 [Betaproteobacteria bacterium]
MSVGLIYGIATVAGLIAFVGIALWAWSSATRERFEQAAMLPFADDEDDSGARTGSNANGGS